MAKGRKLARQQFTEMVNKKYSTSARSVTTTRKEDIMREIKIRIERNIKRKEFTVWLWEDGDWTILTLTPEKLHNLTRNLVNEALESLD